MAELQAKVLAAFAQTFGGVPELVARAPGRVNLIGEHTDYNGGFVLPMAISGETRIAARRREDGLVRIYAADFGASDEFRIDQPIVPDREQPWSNYVRGVIDALRQQGLGLSGAELAVRGSVPKGAGLSSSASLEVACGLAFAALQGHPDYDRTGLALAGQAAEHNFAGCQCGIMDQLVSAQAEAGCALMIDCRSLATWPVSLPPGLAVMIVHSGVERGLVDGAYNLRRQQCEAAALHFGVTELRDLAPERLGQAGLGLDPVVLARARHVVTENQRVLDAVDAMRGGSLGALGAIVAASHASLRNDFEVSVPPVDALVDLLNQAIGGKGGARMTGGGFGGAVVAILDRSAVDPVRDAVLAGYRTPEGKPPLIMIEHPQAGASLVG